MAETCSLTLNGKTHELEAGVYELTMEEYLALDAVSRSGLLTIHEESPADYLFEQERRDTSWSMDFGTAVHTAVLEPHLLDDAYAEYPLPVNKAVKKAETAKSKGVMSAPQAAAFEDENAGRTILPAGDLARAKHLARIVRSRPVIAGLLAQGHAERTLLWQRDGIWLKARPDFWDPERALVVDLKTTRSTSRRILDHAIVDHGNDLQASMIFAGLAALGHRMPFGGKRDGKLLTQYVWLWVRNGADQRPDSVAERMSIEWLERGDRIFESAFATYRECVRTGNWPGLPTNVTAPEAPKWVEHQNASASWEEDEDQE